MRALLLVLSILGAAQAQPRLVMDASQWDFGSIAPDQPVSHRFQIRNAGDRPLFIARLVTSCGCTTTVLGQATLDPGTTTDLEVTFNPTGLHGQVDKDVRVFSDDPAQPELILGLTATIQSVVVPESQVVEFLDLTRAARRKASIRLKSGTGLPIQVADVQLSEAPWLGVVTRETDKDLWVDLDFSAARLPKDKSSGTDWIILRLTNPGPSNASIRVHWEMRRPVKQKGS